MLKPTGSARDPLPSKYKSSSPSTPGLGWVAIGFAAIIAAVVFAQTGWLQHTVALIAAGASAQG